MAGAAEQDSEPVPTREWASVPAGPTEDAEEGSIGTLSKAALGGCAVPSRELRTGSPEPGWGVSFRAQGPLRSRVCSRSRAAGP